MLSLMLPGSLTTTSGWLDRPLPLDAGDKNIVKLNVRDLGRGTWILFIGVELPLLLEGVLSLLGAPLVVVALPLDFVWTPRILRTKFLPGALHSIEVSTISFCLLQRLRSAFVSAIWSKKMPLAHVGAILSLLDGPLGFFVVCL